MLKEINPEYSLEGLMLKLKFQYIGHPMQTVDSMEKTPTLGKIEAGGKGGNRGYKRLNESGDERMRWVICQHRQLNGHKFEQTPGDGEGQGTMACCSPWCCRVGHD